MSNIYDLIIKNGNCFINNNLTQTDIGIKNNQIIKIGSIDVGVNKVLDAKGLTIIPGAIDTQVHFREPGNPDKEDLESGSKAAILGGITSIFEMPNTNPTTDNFERFQEKLDRAKNRMYCNYAFYFGATENNFELIKQTADLEGCCGIKMFVGSSTGTLLVKKDEAIEEVRTEITENIDKYLSYAVKEWVEENTIAIDSGLKVEMADEFMLGLKSLFESNYIAIPEDKIDVVAEMAEEVEYLKKKLNEKSGRILSVYTVRTFEVRTR